jgi:hypothetical protein
MNIFIKLIYIIKNLVSNQNKKKLKKKTQFTSHLWAFLEESGLAQVYSVLLLWPTFNIAPTPNFISYTAEHAFSIVFILMSILF